MFSKIQKIVFIGVATILIFLSIGSFVNNLQAKRAVLKLNKNIESIHHEIFLNRQAIFIIDSNRNVVNQDIKEIIDNQNNSSESNRKRLNNLRKKLNQK